MNQNLKTTLTIGGIFVLLGLSIFFYFRFIAGRPSTIEKPQKIVTKAQNKTYLKYVALSNQEPTTAPTATPTEILSPTPTDAASGITSTEISTPSPSPTEIIVALATPTNSATDEAQITTEPTAIAQLPTTGLIQGSIIIFLIAASMIIFAFVL
ncbi:hypothetical protein A2970_01840 [Candidatus Roizmanbacteria bacterium RIFCSPLOWO2_01_FULL_44_13]|uniref:Gram-positive cocci surface proteins LPxTG domain-containing protein n=1 Tax=Candidatus Roizmanbacteria bacterium RIFCSPLOWO2_01_FULL_44_13 TaxID=1802069 RepID=A0A1F7J9I3_9BACT|nr:MAG: hypothetical protein A2970_01840 [Candidatus Roizmanbacteria bacterium RIFCSPLOWO2_01_FULL_44_13]